VVRAALKGPVNGKHRFVAPMPQACRARMSSIFSRQRRPPLFSQQSMARWNSLIPPRRLINSLGSQPRRNSQTLQSLNESRRQKMPGSPFVSNEFRTPRQRTQSGICVESCWNYWHAKGKTLQKYALQILL
jgi:hypothetical protein